MNIGSVQSQVSMKMLDLKWQKKKNDINTKKKESLTQADILMQSYKQQAEDVRKGKDSEAIYTKLKTGGTLSADEIKYLKQHDPEALADYEKAQAEKKAYKNALKNCKTKEEVERLNLNRMGGYVSRARSIANDPYIPEGKKLELMNKLNNEVCCTKDAHMKFVQEGSYAKLPEEGELAIERAKEQAAKHSELVADQLEAAKENETSMADDSEDKVDEQESKNEFEKHADTTTRDVKLEQKTENTNDLKNVKIAEKISNNQLTFDKVNKEIERQIIKLSSAKPRFTADV